jgi:hypothetical protein
VETNEDAKKVAELLGDLEKEGLGEGGVMYYVEVSYRWSDSLRASGNDVWIVEEQTDDRRHSPSCSLCPLTSSLDGRSGEERDLISSSLFLGPGWRGRLQTRG